MVQTATRPINLEDLQKCLQRCLHAEPLSTVPLQVKCVLRNQTLMILVYHAEPEIRHPKRVFSVIQEILREENITGDYRGIIYLRVQDNHQPYAFHRFMLQSSPLEEKEVESIEDEILPQEDDEESLEIDADLPEADAEEEEEEDKEPETFVEQDNKSWLSIFVTGVGISTVFLLGSLYAVTRPCVIGTCSAIEQSQQLAQSSARILAEPLSGQQILQSQEELEEAIQLVRSIPFWSSKRGEAQGLLTTYQQRSESLEEVVIALKIAARASYGTENLPLPVAKWEETQKLWREAIARLEQVPLESEFYDFAQGKLTAYQQNLKTINYRLQVERESVPHLAAAQEAGKMAEARQGVAQSPHHWQRVKSTWEAAIKRLKQIVPGTSPYTEAQQLLKAYSAQLAIASDRSNKEQLGAQFYKEATRLNQLAKNAEAVSQWSRAVSHRENALKTLEQVPRNTFYYPQSQSEISVYVKDLNRSRVQLKDILTTQAVRRDLEQTCRGANTICYYTLTDKVLKIRLTPTYVDGLRKTAINAQSQGNLEIQVQLLDHVLTLEQALEAISDKAGVPLEVYQGDGILVKSHLPRTIQ